MIVNTLVFNPFQENTYILSDESGQSIIVDPGCLNPNEEKELITFISDKGFQPLFIVNTHLHLDHVFGNRFVAEYYQIPVLAHSEDEFQLSRFQMSAQMFGVSVNQNPPAINQYLNDGDVLTLGQSEIKVIHVPGHSPGSIVLYNAQSNILIAGDVLFNGSIGRTDLPMGDFDQLIDGIQNKLMVLDEATIVYPGHGPATSIKHEKAHNPFLI